VGFYENYNEFIKNYDEFIKNYDEFIKNYDDFIGNLSKNTPTLKVLLKKSTFKKDICVINKILLVGFSRGSRGG
jgi:hypothetical protein